ncbi:SH3 domain-containing protein [Leptospira bourretii]|uniref:SH3 domain-containing protein n=1 Tax=Leptospira bourretii TaxID=2484962 RepID=A0A4R9ISM0_9LEPT|nr:SH3 domain-containing protein [Leptospira bourretii]TGK86210.1 SH3 domain-containing protein [Leptospira bourretii]TGK94979.1 SH3 domain-containing protein [Leptospira bourretii]TGL42479.1 SH3 domain-containing protein [Leptospira bourretii]
MWIKFNLIILMVLIINCGSKGESKIELSDNKCFYIGTWSNNFPVFVKTKLNVSISKFEEEAKGQNYNLKVEKNQISFLTFSTEEAVVLKYVQTVNGIHEFGNEFGKAYLIFKNQKDDEGLEFYASPEDALKKQNLITGGSLYKSVRFEDCLDKKRIAKWFEEYKRELEYGSEPDGTFYKVGPGYHTINKDSVLMRDFPSTQRKVIQKLKKGETVAVIDVETDYVEIEPYGKNYWIKIELPNKKRGYIFGAFVQWKEDFPPGYKIED